jgi:glycosyltransferase involved in cell wall biosynthesis
MTTETPEQSNCSQPQVSVIMPMLNARPFLEESIGSVLSQSFREFELIIVDNFSTDGSKEYAESVPDPRIRVLTESQPGTAYAINTGIAASRADLLALMDADDVSPRNRLKIQVAYMREHPDTVLLGGRFVFLVGTTLVSVAPPLMDLRQIRKALLKGNAVFANGTTMFRADAAKKVGGHCLNGPAHDFDFFLRMSEVGVVHNLPVILQQYRLHEGASTAVRNAFMREQKMFAVACAIARDAGVPEPALADFRREWSVRPRWVKLADRARDVSQHLYRYAIIQRASGKFFSPGVAVLCSAMLNPSQAIWRIKRSIQQLRGPIASGFRLRQHHQSHGPMAEKNQQAPKRIPKAIVLSPSHPDNQDKSAST